MITKVKVFIVTNTTENSDADKLTNQINEWLETNNTYHIEDIDTTSNKYAWMITIKYSISIHRTISNIKDKINESK